MRAVINGYLYDTEKSELIWTDEKNKRNYYRTHNGRFFVTYRTGKIVVKSEDDMRVILGENAVDVYIRIFEEPQEG